MRSSFEILGNRSFGHEEMSSLGENFERDELFGRKLMGFENEDQLLEN